MKYESTILKRLIDTYGVVGNPRYISEIIKEFIVRGKECFPELFTYQADWLAHIDEFGLNPTYTVRYTGQSIYAPNTLERPVKSAILKGQTLVNISMINKFSLTNGNKIARTYGKMIYGKKYLQIIAITKNTMTNSDNNGIAQINAYEYNSNHNFDVEDTIVSGFIGVKKLIGMASRNGKRHDTSLRTYSNSVGVLEGYEILIEYQDGMENWDIPYFEGMQSVQTPVLKTTGKNLFDVATQSTNITINLDNGLVDVQANDRNTSDFINVVSGKTYKSNTTMTRVALYNNGSFVRGVVNTPSIQINSNENQLRFSYNNSLTNIQLEEGSVATDYEPYKSNILTVNEDVTLRSNGSVYDELDLLTGKLTQRIDEDGEVLAKEVIKTVDLNIKDQNNQVVNHLTSFEGGTHFDTSSQTGSVLPTLEVDVVVDLEETLMACSTEGNTM